MTSPSHKDIVQRYYDRGYRVVLWPQIGDTKGPREKDWPNKPTSIADYKEHYRYGLLLGVEVTPGHYLYDVDIDWTSGAPIAQYFLPPTEFLFGHGTKRISHCFYTTPDIIATIRYEDIDRTCLIELRGTKHDGTIGLQTMVPPSVWSKNGKQEPLTFVRDQDPSHVETDFLKSRVMLSAIGMLLAKHLGRHGFGHDVRLAWAGFLLRLGVGTDDLVKMGEAMSGYCENTEVADVKTVVQSTVQNLNPVTGGNPKKVKGGAALEKVLGEKGKAVLAKVREWLGTSEDFIRSDKGAIISNRAANIRRALQLMGHTTSYNLFAANPMIDSVMLQDEVVNNIRFRIEEEYAFQPPKEFFFDALSDLCWNNRFHPVKDYLRGLVWDNTPRLGTWLIECAGATDTSFVRAVSRLVLIAAVRRIMQPGCKFDEMLILESPQGLNKSTALRTLCPNDEWFSDDLPLNVDGQRVIEATKGKWIMEASELVGRRADREHLKSMMSRQTDHARLAYAHWPIDKPREFIIIGTTNSDDYLNDPSGARRFWPVKIQGFDLDLLRGMRDQLWAEAMVQEAANVSIRLPEELWPHAADEQAKRQETSAFEDPIVNLLLEQQPVAGRRRIFADAIWNVLGIEMKDRPRSYRMVGEMMTRLGFRRVQMREGKEIKGGFISIDIGDPKLMQASQDEVVHREIGDGDAEGIESSSPAKKEPPPF